MAGLIGQIEEISGSGTWVDSDARLTNSTGTPVSSATANASGQAIADTYILAFSSVVAGVSATVTVSTASPNNPYGKSPNNSHSISLNASTQYKKIVPGVTLIFSSSGSFTSSWAAEVRVGRSFGGMNAFPPDASVPSTSYRIRVHNSGTASGINCKARIIKRVKDWWKTGQVFENVRAFAAGATEKLTGNQIVPYAVSVLNVSGSGSSKTMDVKVDGSTVNVVNLETGATGTSVGLNVNDFYKFTSSGLTDVEFKLSQAAVNSDIANVLIWNPLFIQMAVDFDGAPGVWGVDDIDLTTDGEETGVMTADGVAFFHVRLVVPEGANSESNPYICDIALEGAATSDAGWVS